jgi:hypothetical protein
MPWDSLWGYHGSKRIHWLTSAGVGAIKLLFLIENYTSMAGR